MSGEEEGRPQDAALEDTPGANLELLLLHLPADSLAARLVSARAADGASGGALREVLDARLDELRDAYGPADQED